VAVYETSIMIDDDTLWSELESTW